MPIHQLIRMQKKQYDEIQGIFAKSVSVIYEQYLQVRNALLELL